MPPCPASFKFFARFAEPQAGAEVAFTVGDLGCPLCLACGQSHREVLFAFPPPNLLNRFVIKAQADGVRAVVITPLAVPAPYWTKLLRASVIPGPAGYERLRKQQDAPPRLGCRRGAGSLRRRFRRWANAAVHPFRPPVWPGG